MGYFGKLNEKNIAQSLRKKGLSYGEILQKIHVSKDTISRWCKDIELSVVQKQRLISMRNLGQRRGSIIAADNKRRRRHQKIASIHQRAKQDIGQLNSREEFIAGVALYAGEGDKTDGQIGFSNANPTLIRFMMKWFRKYCDIENSKYRGAIWLHERRDEKKAKLFWSQLTGIDRKNFYKTYIASDKKDSKKIRKNIHQYGVFAIRVNDSEIHRRIIGWIFALFGAKMPSVHLHSPVAQR
ncbi:hypothetical protein HYW55_05475 [Candidatus Gottesmanbacteria bacterium]|nr:hypothetical protein [Candidatus Gottesmanbacteria bacterium]